MTLEGLGLASVCNSFSLISTLASESERESLGGVAVDSMLDIRLLLPEELFVLSSSSVGALGSSESFRGAGTGERACLTTVSRGLRGRAGLLLLERMALDLLCLP